MWWHTKYVAPINALFSDLSWFILFGYVLVHVCVVGYLDVLSEVHISMFVRWMYILVRPCHKYFLYSMCTIVGSIPIHFIVNCIACIRTSILFVLHYVCLCIYCCLSCISSMMD